MAGFPSSSGGGGGAAAAGWTQIATSTPTGVGTVDFTSIPQAYSELVLSIKGISHNNGSSANCDIYFSNDGATFGTGVTATAGVNTQTYYGGIYIPHYTEDAGSALVAMAHITSTPVIGNGVSRSWRCDGGITAIRVAFSAGNFDAGTITLYGR